MELPQLQPQFSPYIIQCSQRSSPCLVWSLSFARRDRRIKANGRCTNLWLLAALLSSRSILTASLCTVIGPLREIHFGSASVARPWSGRGPPRSIGSGRAKQPSKTGRNSDQRVASLEWLDYTSERLDGRDAEISTRQCLLVLQSKYRLVLLPHTGTWTVPVCLQCFDSDPALCYHL